MAQLSDAWRAALTGGAVNLVAGANLPYLPVWMEKVAGMSGAEMAGAGTLATLLRVFAGPITGSLAASRGLRATLSGAMIVAMSSYALLFPESPKAAALLLCVLINVALGVSGPLFEAILVYGTREGKPDYGSGRAFASANFIAGNLIGGVILGALGATFIVLLLAGLCLIAAIMPLYTKQGAREALPRRSVFAPFQDALDLYRMPGMFGFVITAALLQATHGAYYGFASNLWLAQGVGASHIGALWATGVIAEIVLLMASGKYLARLSPRTLLLLGGGGAIVRWSAASLVMPLFALYVFQTLHAATFALTHLGTMRYLQATLPMERLPQAYSANSALVFGPLLAAAGFSAGLAYDALAPSGAAGQLKLYLIMTVIAFAGTLMCFTLRRAP